MNKTEIIELLEWSDRKCDIHPFYDYDLTAEKFLAYKNQDSSTPENPYKKDWPNSSNIATTQYNEVTNHLDITFKNGLRYRYYDVPASEWETLKDAESIGKYINTRIKGHYQSQNLDKPAQPSNILNAESGL